MPTNSTPTPPVKVLLGCSKCGATLPDESQFCLKCGHPVSLPPRDAPSVEIPLPKPTQQGHKKRIVGLVLLVIPLGAIFWVATSENPFAQGIQEIVGWKHDKSVLETETPFLVGAHSFRYYKFALPEGSVNVSIVGQFNVSSEHGNSGGAKGKDKAEDADNNIEVFVLSEPAFIVWQNGYAAGSVYESGRVSQGTVQAELPAGAGIYYLVFSNKAAPKNPKTVHATVMVRYTGWSTHWFYRIKDWFGL